ncbi:MAG TPA: MoxR family ATPase [Clostridia bacterium]|nr:MoxR family ATPase [Clostridia bacterium]
MFKSIDDLISRLEQAGYYLNRDAATVIYLAWQMKRPLLVEGPAGVGKTELAKTLAQVSQRELIRLQCYEGLDESKALYEWDYQKQLLWIQANLRDELKWSDAKSVLYTREFLLERPLLKALTADKETVLLIDELDKSEEEFESFLLETLSEYQVTIPEYGTIKATSIPAIIITSNSAREFSEALRRRCFHLYLDYPSPETELTIIRRKVPDIDERLGREVVHFVHLLRKQNLRKPPSIAETVDWAHALVSLNVVSLGKELVHNTMMLLVKYREDFQKIAGKLDYLLLSGAK